MSKSTAARGTFPAIILALSTAAGCYSASDAGNDGTTPPISSTEFPCEAAAVLSTCWSCHTTPPRGGATLPLDKLADLRAMSTVAPTQTVAERSLVRLRDAADPMPPRGYPRPSDTDIAMFEAWIGDGMPQGTCEGTDPNQPAPTVCTSQSFWQGGNEESPEMNPGRPCRACHLREEPEKAYYFMGTAYPTLHEKDLCFSSVPTGTRVEILDASGIVRVTMAVLPRGNFYSRSTLAGIALPYTARIVSPSGSTLEMTTKQTSGDCNACHTEQGASDAVGRILIPTP
jgi:hypothetical protein